MKKFFIIIFLLVNSRGYAQVTDTAVNIANACYQIIQAMNSLDCQDNCSFYNILNDELLSDSTKLSLIQSNWAIEQTYNVMIQYAIILDSIDAGTFVSSQNNLNRVTDSLVALYGDNCAPIDGCGGWYAGRRVCRTDYVSNITTAAAGCALGGPGVYAGCYALLALIHTNSFLACLNANDIAYPHCVPHCVGGGFGLNPWFEISDPCDYCNE